MPRKGGKALFDLRSDTQKSEDKAQRQRVKKSIEEARHPQPVVMGGRRKRGRRGGNFWDSLKHAFSSEVWDPKKNGVAKAFDSFGNAVKNEFVNPNSILRSKIIPGITSVGSTVAGFIPGGMPISLALGAAGIANDVARRTGHGHSPPGDGGVYFEDCRRVGKGKGDYM